MEPLPTLPLAQWEPTKDTLHLWVQIVGKVKMASLPPKNHWWHVPLYVDVRGLTTRLLHSADGTGFEIRFDFVDHELVVETASSNRSIELVDGLSVADFDARLHGALGELDVTILEQPFGIPAFMTPFPDDREHATYDAEAVTRFWRVLDWSGGVLDEFSGWYCGKQSPVHLFWHGLDLAVTRFSGRPASPMPDADPVSREAYTHEVISFGFWPETRPCASRRTTRTHCPSRPGCATGRWRRRRRSGPIRAPARSPGSRTRSCGRRPTRASCSSSSWRAPTRRAPTRPAGTAWG